MSNGYDFFATAPTTPRVHAPAPAAAPVAVAATVPAPVAAVGSVPPGWYADPHFPQRWRWYDGLQWTAHVAPASPAQRDRSIEMLLPVNRSGLAIAAGYAGLFAILLVFAPIALVLGVLALRELSTKPTVGGRGRAWFGVVAGAFGTFGLLVAILH